MLVIKKDDNFQLNQEVTLPTWLGEEHEESANKKINVSLFE